MKLQTLTIHNIASIKDAEINFEAEPLASSEVFLITGKTGAGKSTILDAICLALYANTPRMFNTMMQGNAPDEKEVKINDSRQLMRRNTGEATVTLTFIGSNGVHYEALWAVRRARSKPTGTLQKKLWQLTNLDTGHTLTKDNEIKAEIHAAIGLDFDQFCRTTMLAQGEFARFLNSQDGEKAQILEKITGVDVYSKIGAKVFEVTALKQSQWQEATMKVENVHILSDGEMAEMKAVIEALDRQSAALKTTKNQEDAKLKWMNRNNELAKKAAEADEAVRVAKEAVECEEFKEKHQTVEQWNATVDARRRMCDAKTFAQIRARKQQELAELANTYARLSGGLKYEESQARSIEAEIRKIDVFMAAEAEKVGAYENAQTIVSHLSAITDGRKAIEQTQTEIDSQNQTLSLTLKPAFHAAKSKVQSAKEAFAEDEAAVKTQEEAVGKLNLPQLRKKRDEAKDLQTKIATALDRITSLETTTVQYQNKANQLAQLKTSIEKKVQEAAALQAPIQAAKVKMDACREVFDKQKGTVDGFATSLRTKLRVGDTCPVCRQPIAAAFPAEDELLQIVNIAENAMNEAKAAYDAIDKQKQSLEAYIKAETKMYNAEQKAFLDDKSVENARQKAQDACRACAVVWDEESPRTAVKALEQSTQAAVDELNAAIQAAEAEETKAKKLRKAMDKNRKAVEALADEERKSEQAMRDCESKIRTAQALLKQHTDAVNSALQKAESLIPGNWQQDWKQSPKAFSDVLSAAAKNYSQKMQQKQMLTTRCDKIGDTIKHVGNVLSSILSSMPSWAAVQPSKVAEVKALLAEANKLSTAVTATCTQLKEAEENYTQTQIHLQNFLSEHPEIQSDRLAALNALSADSIHQFNEWLKGTREAEIKAVASQQAVNKDVEKHRSEQPQLAEGDTPVALAEHIADIDRQISEIDEKKGASNQLLKTDAENRTRLGTLLEEANQAENEYQRWHCLNELIGDAKGSKFRRIAQAYVLSGLVHAANHYMAQLTDRYTLKVVPGAFVISIEDAYQGYASRSASTISGGESFLVSLSLALALSDIGQTLSVDTLFIDEGFGTLSGEPLQNAISTLRALHTKAGRHVGIISHVKELEEHIPVQIQVNREGNNSSSTVRIIPEMQQQSS